MKRHFVVFYSPGTLVSEITEKPIDEWNVDIAVQMARTTNERYNATPYGFCFITRSRTDQDLDSREVARSGMYFLGGTIRTIEEVRAEKNPKDRILLSNMECNGYSRVIENNNSWKVTLPLNDNDVVLDFTTNRTGATAK